MNLKETALHLIAHPAELGRRCGFDKLGDLHEHWIKLIAGEGEDITIQAHRGSYKTTCITIALALRMMLYPAQNIILLRKTDNDVAEVIKQTFQILSHPLVRDVYQAICGVPLDIARFTTAELSTTGYRTLRGAPQLLGTGIGGSLTGKHADLIITDDIVNLKDRVSRAEREHTKAFYQELQNIRNPGGRIVNTGTPWHKEDAFMLMPPPMKWDYKQTGMLDEERIRLLRQSMAPSLFAANYELRHIPSDDVIFPNAQTGADISLVEQGTAHVDAAYYGEDYTALTVAARHDGKYYVYGRCWRKHVDECQAEIVRIYNELMVGKLYCERNGDKGYLAKQLRAQGVHTVCYDENQNKYIKITSHLKGAWENVIFVGGTDEQYIRQIEDFNENAEHDDCPDSLASLIRVLSRRREEDETYESLWALG